MRYAIISDLHANRQAFRAVLADIESAGVDQVICLGDIVGYGPAPAEVLALAYERVHHFVLGNHDAVIAGSLDAECFNDNARKAIEWTSKQLDTKAREFFAGLPLVLEGDGFRCVHGELTDPPAFNYLIEEVDALASWAMAPKDVILFAGHTHMPGMFVIGESGRAHALPPQDFSLEPGKRYIVNAGSVGQPRDGEMRASWVLFDTDTGAVFFRKTPFDVEGFKADLSAAGLPQAAGFLAVAETKRLPPLREQLDFRPIRRKADAPKPDYKVVRLEAELRSAHKQASRWRKAGLLALLLLVLAGAVAVWAVPRALRPPPSVTYDALETAVASAPDVMGNLLVEPEALAGAVSATNRLRRWSVMVAEPVTQRVEVRAEPTKDGSGAKDRISETEERKNGKTKTGVAAASHGTVPSFVIKSGVAKAVGVYSAVVLAVPGERFTVSSQFRTEELKTGWIELALLQRLPDGTEKQLGFKAVKTDLSGRWKPVQFTLDKEQGRLKQAGQVRVAIRGEFIGRVLVRKCMLVKCE